MLALEKTAQQWMQDEAQSRAERNPFPDDVPDAKLQLGPAKWVLPKLLRIVYQHADQPIEVLVPLIRSMLQEQAFANTGGDPCDCERLDESIEETVWILVQVLKRARKYCQSQAELV